MTEVLLSHRELESLRHQARQLPSYRVLGNSPLSGPQRSPQRGLGMELEDLRPYQIGDDVRHIAWRASARSGRTISKVFRAERRQRILLLVEQHPGMAFATRGELKAAVASRTVALLCFAALKQGAEVGGMVLHAAPRFFQPGKRLDQALALVGAANQAPGQHPPARIETHLHQLLQSANRDDAVYLISDFQHWQPALRPVLAQLAERHPVQALQIMDEGEQNLPAIGKLRLRSPFDGREVIIDSNTPKIREQYAQAMTARQAEIKQLFRTCGVRHQILTTDGDLLAPLSQVV